MPAEPVMLDFYGARVELRSTEAAALGELSRDFAYFRVPTGGRRADIGLELRASAPGSRLRRAHWRWRSARIRHGASARSIDYEGRARLEYDFARERGTLRSAEPALLRELGYLTVLSRVGERLDLQGLHRVHALGFSFRGRGGLLLLPAGGGKSRLALALLGRAGFELLSDDIPLLAGQELAAFSLGIGLRGADRQGVPERFLRPFARRRFGLKHVVDLEYFQGQVRARAPLAWVLVGERDGASRPRLEACSRLRAAAAMAKNLVLGLGTPQVLELVVPSRLAGIALRRARCAALAVSSARCGRFRLGSDAAANAQALARFLDASG